MLRITLSSYQDPFEEYKVRLSKKLAKQAEAQNPVSAQPATAEKKPGDGMNWFGVKLGEDATSTSGGGGSGLGGVGKYLNLKRPPQTAAVAEHPKKKKTGFGEFENF